MADPLFDILNIKLAHVVAGGLGGALRAIVLRDGGWLQYAVSIFAGAVCASYLGPFVAHWLPSTAGDGFEASVYFVSGVVGMTIVEGLMIAAKKWRPPSPGAGS